MTLRDNLKKSSLWEWAALLFALAVLIHALSGCAAVKAGVEDTTGSFFRHGTETFWAVLVGTLVYIAVPSTGLVRGVLTALGAAVGAIFSHADPAPYQPPGFFEALPGRILGIVMLIVAATVLFGGEHRWHFFGLAKRGISIVKSAVGRWKGSV